MEKKMKSLLKMGCERRGVEGEQHPPHPQGGDEVVGGTLRYQRSQKILR